MLHKVTAKKSSKNNVLREPWFIIYHIKRSNCFLFGAVANLAHRNLATDVLAFKGGFAGAFLGAN